MLINSKRANEIDVYINFHDCAKGKQKVVIDGEVISCVAVRLVLP